MYILIDYSYRTVLSNYKIIKLLPITIGRVHIFLTKTDALFD